jgi:hypothetical protein
VKTKPKLPAEKFVSTAQAYAYLSFPESWLAPYVYLSRQSVHRKEIAPFCGQFPAAYNGDRDALQRVFETRVLAYRAAKRYVVKGTERDCTNAIVFLCNQLAKHIESKQEPAEQVDQPQPVEEISKPAAKIEQAKQETPVAPAPHRESKDKTSIPGRLAIAEKE